MQEKVIGEWIPCTEGAPRDEGYYLVLEETVHGEIMNICYFGSEHFYECGEFKIKAWMPH